MGCRVADRRREARAIHNRSHETRSELSTHPPARYSATSFPRNRSSGTQQIPQTLSPNFQVLTNVACHTRKSHPEAPELMRTVLKFANMRHSSLKLASERGRKSKPQCSTDWNNRISTYRNLNICRRPFFTEWQRNVQISPTLRNRRWQPTLKFPFIFPLMKQKKKK